MHLNPTPDAASLSFLCLILSRSRSFFSHRPNLPPARPRERERDDAESVKFLLYYSFSLSLFLFVFPLGDRTRRAKKLSPSLRSELDAVVIGKENRRWSCVNRKPFSISSGHYSYSTTLCTASGRLKRLILDRPLFRNLTWFHKTT